MSLVSRIRQLLHRFLFLKRIETGLTNQMVLQARLLHESNMKRKDELKKDIKKAEFRVFSQWGDDGIIQFLVEYLSIEEKTFVEFGVENYREANTRFLLINNQWRGLVLDGDKNNIDAIKKEEIYWKYDLRAKHAFVSCSNINQILESYDFKGDIGVMSIDVDGNDYWIWESITAINPIIVVIEYNAVFGKERLVTIPYREDFIRTKAHYSNLFFGASVPALCKLADVKGYCFIGCTSSGNNAYFVRKDHVKDLAVKTPQEGFVDSFPSDSRDQKGKLTFLRGSKRLELIKGLEVVNVETGDIEKL